MGLLISISSAMQYSLLHSQAHLSENGETLKLLNIFSSFVSPSRRICGMMPAGKKESSSSSSGVSHPPRIRRAKASPHLRKGKRRSGVNYSFGLFLLLRHRRERTLLASPISIKDCPCAQGKKFFPAVQRWVITVCVAASQTRVDRRPSD